MIYAITSRSSGCGRSAVALMTAIISAEKIKGSTVLVDLGYGNDIYSMLKMDKPSASLDNLISAIGLDSSYVDFDENIIDIKGVWVLPGTSVKQSRYLEKRYIQVKDLLEVIQCKFNSIILDIDYSLYEELVDLGMEITPIHILEQNMLNVEKYQEDIRKQIFEGFYILNKYNDDVFPQYSFFEKNFKIGSLITVEHDSELVSSFNRKKISSTLIKNSKCFKGIEDISKIIADNKTTVETTYVSKSNKPSLLSRLIPNKKKGGKSNG